MTFALFTQGVVALVNAFVIPLMYALAFLFFVAGLARYAFIESSEESREKGKQMMIYGLIGLVVIFGVWGIVNVVLSTLTGALGGGV